MHRALAAAFLFASVTEAQDPKRAPIRPLGAIVAKAPVTFDTLINVRGLSDGRIIVNDAVGFKLVSLDASFTKVTVWSDTTPATKHNYGTQPAVIMPGLADSSIMMEMRSSSLVAIDPQGNFGRVFALPKAGDATNVALSTMYGGAGFDPKGRIVYVARPDPIAVGNPGCSPTKPALSADSTWLVRADFDTRQIDTLARIKFSYLAGDLIPNPNQAGCWTWRQKADVLPYHGDQWTVLPDGAVAIVREQDYHIDWIGLDGKMTSSPKMPFDWRPITDDEKQRMIDSATKMMDSIAAARPIPAGAPPNFKNPSRPVVSAAQIPDYVPPTRLGSMKVDFDGNLWIPPSTSRDARGGILYDVVNRKGEVFERVQLPAGRAIAAFVPGGRVVLRSAEGKKVVLELANVRSRP
ncbi:MAG TPA: hypothetical protein VE967_14900 [Gemmatimonadaceae bacterium]|nr:hypothetical protein [Gemmatimonadaceae bacterium]